ncbi:hypothetical protein [Magnetospirillum gryphiswaldense]|uniref:Uncharacterized protein n=1 Tax=Magnetospirillum gryphiswaldense TaxID=55518 RepID=A4U2T0_9PROT|nr:hypothetical protein [Magnetospirillum gryphiswaldense]AVM74550.1 hypothetical protein MSR1_20620 [Magnetospirillum gryphiswaldense MSR-1]AVM78453.1 hypothetical protein MSR1L_20620 [Magnetospirillum gryphiswaldense]CAM77187.1 conserved hypothetical protein [Magnetospirillum gryphiswaldense MSR-1]
MSTGIVKFTEEQMNALIHDKWDGSGPCRLNETLTLADLAATSVIPNTRILMADLDGAGAKLTAKGNLNRKLVESLAGHFQWQGYPAERVWSVNKVLNEDDYTPALYLHGVLKLAVLARTEKGFIKLTRKGKALLAEDAAGQLQATLFRTTFTRYNLAYLDRYEMKEFFAWQISVILYLIGQFCNDWRAEDALMRSVTMPSDEALNPRWPGAPVGAFKARVLRYLCWFGLLEEKQAAANDDWRQPRLFRKTALYDRMLSFRI